MLAILKKVNYRFHGYVTIFKHLFTFHESTFEPISIKLGEMSETVTLNILSNWTSSRIIGSNVVIVLVVVVLADK